MTNDKLERVARAIHAADGTWNDLRWSDLPAGARRKFREYAAAAIAACEAEAGERERESITLEAVAAGEEVVRRFYADHARGFAPVKAACEAAAIAIYTAMCRAALNTTAGEGEVG